MKYFVSVVVLLVISAFAVSGQQPVSPWLNESDRARLESLRKSGLEALYDIDYDKAYRDFKEIATSYPNHPAGPQLLASRLWIKTLYESRRLQSSLYSSESFYTNGDDKVDPKLVDEFRGLTREAKRLAEAKLKQDPKNIEALDYLANTEGLKASFEEAVERRHFAALRDGNDAVDHHRQKRDAPDPILGENRFCQQRAPGVAAIGEERVLRVLVGVVAQGPVRPRSFAPFRRWERLCHAEIAEAVEDRFALIDFDRLRHVCVVAEDQIRPSIDAVMGCDDLIIGDDPRHPDDAPIGTPQRRCRPRG